MDIIQYLLKVAKDHMGGSSSSLEKLDLTESYEISRQLECKNILQMIGNKCLI
jgi:hypothetical protein